MNIHRHIVLFTVSFFFFYEFGLNNIFNALAQNIALEYALSPVMMGMISSLYFYANIALLLPAGLILDRYSPRKVITIAMLTCSTGVLIVSFSSTLFWLMISRILMGLGGGFCFVGCIRIAANWYDGKHIATASGFIVTMGMLGGYMVQGPMSHLIQQYGWRTATGLVALIGYGITVLIWMIVRDAPDARVSACSKDQANVKRMGLLASAAAVLRRPQNFLCGLYTSLMNLPLYVLGALWGIPTLMTLRHMSHTDAAHVCGMLFLGTMFGAIAINHLSTLVGSRRIPMMLGALLSLILLLVLMQYTQSLSDTQLACLFFALGLTTSTQCISYPTVIESNDNALASTATSVISTLSLTGGAISGPLFGHILASTSTVGDTGGNHLLYPASSYQYATWMLPVASVFAIVCVYFIKETHCKRTES